MIKEGRKVKVFYIDFKLFNDEFVKFEDECIKELEDLIIKNYNEIVCMIVEFMV